MNHDTQTCEYVIRSSKTNGLDFLIHDQIKSLNWEKR